MENPDRFVAMRCVVRWRGWLPWLAAAVVLGAGLALSVWTQHRGWTIGGIVLAPLAWAVARLAVEVVDLVAETLLPR